MKTDNMLFNLVRFNPRTDKVLIRDLKTLKFFVLPNEQWLCVPKKNLANKSCMDYHFPKLNNISDKRGNEEYNKLSHMIAEIRDYPGVFESLINLGIPDTSMGSDPKCVLLGLKLMAQHYGELVHKLKEFNIVNEYLTTGTLEQDDVKEFMKEIKSN